MERCLDPPPPRLSQVFHSSISDVLTRNYTCRFFNFSGLILAHNLQLELLAVTGILTIIQCGGTSAT